MYLLHHDMGINLSDMYNEVCGLVIIRVSKRSRTLFMKNLDIFGKWTLVCLIGQNCAIILQNLIYSSVTQSLIEHITDYNNSWHYKLQSNRKNIQSGHFSSKIRIHLPYISRIVLFMQNVTKLLPWKHYFQLGISSESFNGTLMRLK